MGVENPGVEYRRCTSLHSSVKEGKVEVGYKGEEGGEKRRRGKDQRKGRREREGGGSLKGKASQVIVPPSLAKSASIWRGL